MKTTNISTITKKGQVTIPKAIREHFKIKPHDKIEFEIKDNVVRLKPLPTLESNFGRVKPIERPEDFKKLRKFFEERTIERDS